MRTVEAITLTFSISSSTTISNEEQGVGRAKCGMVRPATFFIFSSRPQGGVGGGMMLKEVLLTFVYVGEDGEEVDIEARVHRTFGQYEWRQWGAKDAIL